MSEVERYLKQATRGLSGQARRDAKSELRGAIEDKVWRFTLLGMEPGEATRAALRDLGSPHAIASGLTQVHTLPKAALGAVLAGVACLLGVQALARVPEVRAAPDPAQTAPLLCVFNEAAFQTLSAAQAAPLRRALAQPGGRARLEKDCWSRTARPANSYLRFTDVLAAFTAGGFTVRALPGAVGFLMLTIPGIAHELEFNVRDGIKIIDGHAYLSAWALLNIARSKTTLPIQLTGEVNPVLDFGPAHIQLGTLNAPVRRADLLVGDVYPLLSAAFVTATGHASEFAWNQVPPAAETHHLMIQVPPGTLVMTVSNQQYVGEDPQPPFYLFRLQLADRGQVPVSFPNHRTVQAVTTLQAFVTATHHRQPALLVYQFDPSDLRSSKLAPVPASSLKLNP
ncbi:permease prefix domain 1-containing protein [Deinococcus altitudinis]|uniref:permease prefix domain 1-containing protein n=1 Tax=Deinococcus altitudinis TaxID=468914 RepID=UPI003891E65D